MFSAVIFPSKPEKYVFSCGAYPCTWSHTTLLQLTSVWKWYKGTFRTALHREWLLLRFRNLVNIAIFYLCYVLPKSGGSWQLGRTQECAYLPSFTKQVCSWLKYYWNKNKTTLPIHWMISWVETVDNQNSSEILTYCYIFNLMSHWSAMVF